MKLLIVEDTKKHLEATAFPFNIFNGPEFLKKFFIGGIYTQLETPDGTSDLLTGAAGYSNNWLTVYVKKDEGMEPAGYVTFRKEF